MSACSCSTFKHLLLLCLAASVLLAPVLGRKSRSVSPNYERYFDEIYNQGKQKTDPKSVPFERETQLYSRSSGYHLRIIKRHIDALGTHGDPLARLIIESDNFGRIRIRSAVNNHYVCVRSDGELIGRKNGKRLNKCVFMENIAKNMFTEFHSAYKENFFITISKKGLPRLCNKGASGRKFVQFIERPLKIIIPSTQLRIQAEMVRGLQEHIARLLAVSAENKDEMSRKKKGKTTHTKKRRNGERKSSKHGKFNPTTLKNLLTTARLSTPSS